MSFQLKYALIGHPLIHSFSANLFNKKFEIEGINAKYDNIDIEDISLLPEIIKNTPNLRGLNVTSPHKTSVLSILDTLTDEAREIGAVNTIRITYNNVSNKPYLEGDNTDSRGFKQSLQTFLNTQERQIAIVAGATGGAGKAICHALKQLDIEIIKVSRQARNGCIGYSDIDKTIMQKADIIINATPLGMHPNTGELIPIPYHMLTNRHLCYDLIYNPAETEFLRIAKKFGAKVCNGLQMLLNQAELSWKFYGTEE